MGTLLDPVQRLLRSGELTSACSVDPFPFQFCHCSQCFSLVCATDLMTSHAWLRTVSHAHVVHFLNLVAERWVPGSVNS